MQHQRVMRPQKPVPQRALQKVMLLQLMPLLRVHQKVPQKERRVL